MRKIILASKSKARKKLLEQIGLRFTVTESKVKEKKGLSLGCGRLVVENALRKAGYVAEIEKSGVIISADTVVLVNGKVVGKPENTQDAVRSLKLISRYPQWVYTGIAVIDLDHKKVFTDYEKTKIYMNRLTDSQIRKYFKRVSPRNLAGSFDVQGLGGIFVNRIEGCFYNVVGLPLAKLAKLLAKAGIDVF